MGSFRPGAGLIPQVPEKRAVLGPIFQGLKDGAEKPADGLGDLEGQRPLGIDLRGQVNGIFNIFFKSPAKVFRDFFGIDNLRGFKVQVKGTFVHVGGADHAAGVVHEEHLGMKKAAGIGINVSAFFHHLAGIGKGGRKDNGMVLFAGDHKIYLDADLDGHDDGVNERGGGNKVGGLDVDPMLGGGDHLDHGQLDIVEAGIGAGGDHLTGNVPDDGPALVGEVGLVLDVLTRGVTPVLGKAELDVSNGIALDPEVGIPPVTEFRVFSDVFIPDVKAADISNGIVDRAELAVIAVVEAEVDKADQGGEKDRSFNSGLAHLAEGFIGELSAADSVGQKADMDASSGRLDEVADNFLAQAVGFYDVVFDLNISLGPVDV